MISCHFQSNDVYDTALIHHAKPIFQLYTNNKLYNKAQETVNTINYPALKTKTKNNNTV